VDIVVEDCDLHRLWISGKGTASSAREPKGIPGAPPLASSRVLVCSISRRICVRWGGGNRAW